MDIKQALAMVVGGTSLSREQMGEVMLEVMTGKATEAQVGALLMGLRMKGETVDEIAGAADVMRRLAIPVNVEASGLVDTCGTGGDGARLFNVSTASALVVAAAGGKVAKHGNRSVTSSAGSADVLEAAGVNLAIDADQVARCVMELGVGFMFAPSHHGAMKFAIGPRCELALRTIFNLLGPLTNPAGAKRQVIGVFKQALCQQVAEVLLRMGSEHVLVVHSDDGLDEISIAGATHVAELKDGKITQYQIHPQDFGLEPQSLEGLQVSSAKESLALIRDALGKRVTAEGVKAADMVALNAGAAIYVAGLAPTLAEGVNFAEDTIASGLAGEKLNELSEFTACLP